MDRRVKERLVGASILVVLIVLIVPELLSGPKSPGPAAPRLPTSAPEPIRNVTVDLATSKPPAMDPAPDARQAPSSAASSAGAASAAAPAGGDVTTAGDQAADPTPSANDSAPASPSARLPAPRRPPTVTTLPGAAPAAAVPAATASRTLETAPPSPRSGGNRAWAVQIGSFSSRVNADKLVHQLKAQGFAVYVLTGGSGHAVRYRVRIGPLADRGAAAQEMAKLKGMGHAASIVAPAS